MAVSGNTACEMRAPDSRSTAPSGRSTSSSSGHQRANTSSGSSASSRFLQASSRATTTTLLWDRRPEAAYPPSHGGASFYRLRWWGLGRQAIFTAVPVTETSIIPLVSPSTS